MSFATEVFKQVLGADRALTSSCMYTAWFGQSVFAFVTFKYDVPHHHVLLCTKESQIVNLKNSKRRSLASQAGEGDDETTST